MAALGNVVREVYLVATDPCAAPPPLDAEETQARMEACKVAKEGIARLHDAADMEERFGDRFRKAIKNKEKPSREEIKVHVAYAEKCQQAMADITMAQMLLPDKEFRKSISEAFGVHLLPRPWGSRNKDEMSAEENTRYGGSFTLAVDGAWYTNEDGDALNEMELRAVEVKAAAAFEKAEEACISLYEEGSWVALSKCGTLSVADQATRRQDIAVRAKSALANLEIARRDLPRREQASGLESEPGRRLLKQHPQLVDYVTSIRSAPPSEDCDMAANEGLKTGRYGVEHVNEVDIEESDIESMNSETLQDDLPEEEKVEMQLLALDLARWATKGAKLIGDAFGQRGLEDAFLGNICFDEDNKCYEVVTDENGLQVIHDLTQGLRMAQKSGMDERQSLAAIFTKCARCGVGMPTGGDKALLKSRDGPTATYWCKKCAMEDHFEKTGIPLTTRQFKIKSATAAGRPFLTSQGIEKSALFKLTMGTFGTAGREADANRKSHSAAGCGKKAVEKVHEHGKRRRRIRM